MEVFYGDGRVCYREFPHNGIASQYHNQILWLSWHRPADGEVEPKSITYQHNPRMCFGH